MPISTRTTRRRGKAIVLLVCLVTAPWSLPGETHEALHHEGPIPAETTDRQEQAGDVRGLIRTFRQTGDDRQLDRAWVTLEPRLETATVDTLLDAAVVAQSRHDFDLALELIDRALATRRSNDQAWLLRAAIQLVRGDVEDAAHACRELRSSALLVTVTCRARVHTARGDNVRALQVLSAVLSAVDASGATGESYAWALSAAGDAAAPVDARRAIRLYEQSLAIVDSTQVRAALVDVLLAENRLEDAYRVLPAATRALALQVRRMIVSRRLAETGDHLDPARESEHAVAAADHRFRHWIADEDWVHAREMARFYLDVVDEPKLARRLAQMNLSLQREPEDVLLAQRTGVLSHAAQPSR